MTVKYMTGKVLLKAVCNICANGQHCPVYTEPKDSLYSCQVPFKYFPNVFSDFLRGM